MVYYGNYVTEGILFHTKEDINDFYIIALTKNVDGKTFRVEVDFNDDWHWEFDMSYPGNYEIVKHTIMDIAFDSDNADELLMELDACFEELFAEIAAMDQCEDTCDCEKGCKHCGCN